MLDFRFRVLDPEKAATLLRRQDKPYLIDEASGNKLAVPRMPKVGALRPSALNPKPGEVYFVLFNNTGDWSNPAIRSPSLAEISRAEHLVVE